MPTRAQHDQVAWALDATGLGRMLRAVGVWPGVLVLTYHRVTDPEAVPFDRDAVNATRDGFARQLAVLARETEVIGAASFADALRRRRGRRVLITFDDGYRDNYDVALPLLRRHGMPALFFLATGFLDRPRLPWWDELAWMRTTSAAWNPGRGAAEQCRSLPPAGREAYLDDVGQASGTGRAPAALARELWMTWDMVRDMRDAGMAIGGHTVDHPLLAALPPAEQDRQIADCGARIREETGRPMTLFAYPFGRADSFDSATRHALRRHGVHHAFSFSGDLARRRSDALAVPRVSVNLATTPARLRSALTLPSRLVWP